VPRLAAPGWVRDSPLDGACLGGRVWCPDGREFEESYVGEQRVVIVSGSTSGIGRAIARRCMASGWATVVNSRSSADAGEKLIGGAADAIYVQGDVSRAEDCAVIVAAALDRWGRIDALVNNAATTTVIPHEDVVAADAAVWRRILDVNLVGTWLLISAALPALRQADPGSIVNIASVAGLRPVGSSLPYAVSKAGLIHMTTLLAKALGPAVLVNAIAPGMIETPLTADWSDAREFIEQHSALHRTGEPEEVADLCDWLLKARYTTGECVSIDGGMRLAL
jgi:ketoreductase RED2